MTFPYQLGIGDPTASEPSQDVTLFESWELERNFDDGCTFTFNVPGDSPAAALLVEMATDVWIYDRGVADQRFRIVEVEQEWDDDGDDRALVTAVCYRRLLASRHVWAPLDFSSTSQGLILWGLYQHTQALPGGDWGVTLGDPGPSIPRDRSYVVGQNLLEMAVNLSEVVNGPSFDVDPLKQLLVSQPGLRPVLQQPIQLGANARRIRRPSGAAEFGNAAIGFGDTEATAPAFAESTDIATDPRGRWERTVSRSSVTEQSTVQDYADGLVEEAQSPPTIWHAELHLDRFLADTAHKVGDFIEIVEPRSTVVASGDPSNSVMTQVLTQLISADADGNVIVEISAIEAEPS